ncbi:hypothetical protein EP331_06010 [bacterium]|nr:MAG: hypothetical protein EP331_06010 [bacterium]
MKHITIIALSMALTVQFVQTSSKSCKVSSKEMEKKESMHCSMGDSRKMSCCSMESKQEDQTSPKDESCSISCNCSITATVEKKLIVSTTEVQLVEPDFQIVFENELSSKYTKPIPVYKSPPDDSGGAPPLYKKNAVFLI